MKLVKINELFDVQYGANLELVSLEECQKGDNNSINFISRTEKNNGISAFVQRDEKINCNKANTLSVAGGGSVLSTFYQAEEYYSGRDIYILIPKYDFSPEEMLFYAYCIRRNKYRYNYGRQANKTLKDILIPERMPVDWEDITINKLNRLVITPIKENQLDLNLAHWKAFKLIDIFRLEKCRCSSATDLLGEGEDVYYIGAKKSHNGVMSKVVNEMSLISKGNCIVFIGDGQGSVGFTNYQPVDFIGSTTLTCGYNENLNPYVGLFLVTVLDKERYRYNYGRKYGKDQLSQAKIELPSTPEGNPNWNFMENYIKSLPYSSSL